MIIKGNYEKKIQIIRSKLPTLNILRINENEWVIKEPSENEQKQIQNIFNDENKEVKIMTNQPIQPLQAPNQAPNPTPNQAQNFNGNSTELVTRGLAMMIEPILKDIDKLKEVDKQHADARFNFENSTSKHFSTQEQALQELQKNQIAAQARLDELVRDYEDELEKSESLLTKEIESLKDRKEKMQIKFQKLREKKEQHS